MYYSRTLLKCMDTTGTEDFLRYSELSVTHAGYGGSHAPIPIVANSDGTRLRTVKYYY